MAHGCKGPTPVAKDRPQLQPAQAIRQVPLLLNPFYTTLNVHFPFGDQDGDSGSSRMPVFQPPTSTFPVDELHSPFCSPFLVLPPILTNYVFLIWTQAIPGKHSDWSGLGPTPAPGFALGAGVSSSTTFPEPTRGVGGWRETAPRVKQEWRGNSWVVRTMNMHQHWELVGSLQSSWEQMPPLCA